MPSSGPLSPLARRSSARFASARARASSTVMNAFNSLSRRLIRSRWSLVSSTEETFLAWRAAESSERVALSTLLDDLGHQVQAVLGCRRDLLVVGATVGLGDFVPPETLPLRKLG